MIIYFLYAEEEKLNNHIKISIPQKFTGFINGKEYLLYAFSKKKKYIDTFLKERTDIFVVKEKDLDKKEYKKLIIDSVRQMKLSYNTFTDGKNKVKLLTTQFEYENCHCHWFEDILPEETFPYLTPESTKLFKDKYIEALTFVGLNCLIYICDSDKRDLEMCFYEFEFSEDMSYLTVAPPAPNKSNPHFELSFDIKSKDLNVFIHFYKSILRLK